MKNKNLKTGLVTYSNCEYYFYNFGGYGRSLRTFPERRDKFASHGLYRAKRNGFILDPYNNEQFGLRSKAWKHVTKCKKQYEVNL